MTSTERRGRRASALLAVTLAVLAPGVARAQAPQRSAGDIAQARALFIKAKEQRASGDVEGALEKFKAAHALGGTPLTGLELGRTYRMLGLLIEAREAFLAVVRLPLAPEETSRSADARREASELAEQLEGRIPSVSIVVTGTPAAPVVVSIDDVTVRGAALVAPRPVNPGKHTLVATSGASRAEARVELREGEAKTVELRPVVFPAGVLRSSPPVAGGERLRARRWLTYAGFGVGGAGLVAGAITGAVAFRDASVVKTACQGAVCPVSIDGNLKTGRVLGAVSNVAFAFGGASVAAGVLALVVGRSRPAPLEVAGVRPWIGPCKGGVEGMF